MRCAIINERSLISLEYMKITDILTEKALTPVGKELCSELRPETTYEVVNDMLYETDAAVALLICAGNPPLFEIRDMRPVVIRLDKNALLNNTDLMTVAAMLKLSRNMKEYISGDGVKRAVQENGGDNPIAYAVNIIQNLFTDRRLEEKISDSVVGEFEISDSASDELYSIRRKIKDQQNNIKNKLNEMIHSSRYQKYIQDSIVTLRGDRYVIPVKSEYRGEVPGIVHDTSQSGATLFIEPMPVLEANNKIRELKVREEEEIQRILYALSAAAALDIEGLKTDILLIGKLDFMFAKAKFSVEYDCCSPKMNNDGYINIIKGRHPLIPKDKVVPIDCNIGKDFITLVVTGPNTGGKTVSLKTVGLFSLLAQSGLHVPAAWNTELTVFDNIYADIGDEQSIEQNLSTFSAHMTNIVSILSGIEGRPLVLLDELGAGTDPTEGAGLAMSILEYLNKIKCVTMATTHYSELKVFAATTEGVENACCEFNVETLQPTYKLLIGIPGKSNAFAISKKLGLWDFIVDRAREYISKEELSFEDLLLDIEKNREKAQKDREDADNMLRKAIAEKKDLQAQIDSLTEKKEKLLTDAKDKAKKMISDAKAEMKDILSEAEKLKRSYGQSDFNKQAETLKQRVRDAESKVSSEKLVSPEEIESHKPPDIEEIKVGVCVKVVSLDSKGNVLTLPKNGIVTVQLGTLQTKVNISDLRLIDKPPGKKPPARNVSAVSVKSMSIAPQIDLRGKLVGEGIEELDKYIDSALIAGLSTITVVHGKGTGAMRAGVHDFLKSHPRVKSYRIGNHGEGDYGVTIAELK